MAQQVQKINNRGATMNAAQRKLITGGLSKPSKMPGYAYNLPAIHCKTGSKLAQVPGTTCHGCYALKGRYRFPNVMDAMMRRLASISRPDWARTMAADINARKSRWFRWHDSGDIQSVKHLLKIFQVCRMTPDVAHWLPTREAGLLSCLLYTSPSPRDVEESRMPSSA